MGWRSRDISRPGEGRTKCTMCDALRTRTPHRPREAPPTGVRRSTTQYIETLDPIAARAIRAGVNDKLDTEFEEHVRMLKARLTDDALDTPMKKSA